MHKILNLKGIFAILSRFGNVVNRAFLVLIFLGKKLVGANFYAFCNYVEHLVENEDIVLT